MTQRNLRAVPYPGTCTLQPSTLGVHTGRRSSVFRRLPMAGPCIFVPHGMIHTTVLAMMRSSISICLKCYQVLSATM